MVRNMGKIFVDNMEAKSAYHVNMASDSWSVEGNNVSSSA